MESHCYREPSFTLPFYNKTVIRWIIYILSNGAVRRVRTLNSPHCSWCFLLLKEQSQVYTVIIPNITGFLVLVQLVKRPGTEPVLSKNLTLFYFFACSFILVKPVKMIRATSLCCWWFQVFFRFIPTKWLYSLLFSINSTMLLALLMDFCFVKKKKKAHVRFYLLTEWTLEFPQQCLPRGQHLVTSAWTLLRSL